MNHKITDTTLKSDNQNNHTTYISRKNYTDNKKIIKKNKFMIGASIISISLIVIIGMLLKHLSKKSDISQEVMILDQKNKEKENTDDLKKDNYLLSNNQEIIPHSTVQDKFKESNRNKLNDIPEISNNKQPIITNNNAKKQTIEVEKKLNSHVNTITSNNLSLNKKNLDLPLNANNLEENNNEINFIQTSPDNYYTIQFGSSFNLKELKNYAKNNNLNPFWIHSIYKNGKYQYLLISGQYSSLKEAQNIINKLPEHLKFNKPWIRKINQIK